MSGTTTGTVLSATPAGNYESAVQTVEGGGVASRTTIQAGAIQYVDQYGSAVGTIVSSGGVEYVDAGHSFGTVVHKGGVLSLTDGALTSGVTVASGGIIVLDGGTVKDLKLAKGAQEIINLHISSGQTKHGVTLSGNTMEVQSGGTVVGTTVLAPPDATTTQLMVIDGGTASGTTIVRGDVTVYAGREVGTTLSGNGSDTVGARNDIYSGGTATGTTIEQGGQLEVARGAYATGTFVYGSNSVVFGDSGSRLDDTKVGSGGSFFTQARAAGVKVLASGSFEIGSGGVASNIVVSSGASLTVDLGAKAANVIVMKGGTLIRNGGQITGLKIGSGGSQTVYPYVYAGQTLSGTKVPEDQILTVLHGGTVVHARATGDGELVVSGGTAIGTVLSGSPSHRYDQPSQLVFDGGVASGTIVSGFGGEYIDEDGKSFGTHLLDHSEQDVTRTGIAVRTVVASGTRQIVRSGGTASGTVLEGGSETILTGGQVGGTVTFASTGTLSFETKSASAQLSGFAKDDNLVLGHFGFGKAETLSFVENAAKTRGVLTLTDGTVQAKFTLFGQYAAAGFHMAQQGAGTLITYQPPTAAQLPLAVTHR
ncbi:MAG TPA: AIDA repeat-containing protein [Alphaproteobacteria bacterium]|nr:AIDA repeat-containing protein [Alphaproteobacteria bacterium]